MMNRYGAYGMVRICYHRGVGGNACGHSDESGEQQDNISYTVKCCKTWSGGRDVA